MGMVPGTWEIRNEESDIIRSMTKRRRAFIKMGRNSVFLRNKGRVFREEGGLDLLII
jgi:hypothetical protein